MPQFTLRPLVIAAEPWNPPVDGRPRLAADVAHPRVRGSSYIEVSRLLGTAGCSRHPPYWDWSVLGILDNDHGLQVVEPGDWLLTLADDEILRVSPPVFTALIAAGPVPRYVRKPRVVEAVLYDGSKPSFDALWDWMDGDALDSPNQGYEGPDDDHPGPFGIRTRNGRQVARPGDWIVRLGDGEFEPVPADAFARDYEPAPAG